MNKEQFEGMVRWAEEQLQSQVDKYREVRNELGLSAADERILEHISHLEEARAASDTTPDRGKGDQTTLLQFELEAAFRSGLLPDGSTLPNTTPYSSLLRNLLEQSQTNADAFDALSIHAANYVENGGNIPLEVRQFIVRHLRGDLQRPKAVGAPPQGTLLDELIYPVIVDLVAAHNLKPTHSEFKATGTSACAVVAQAMANLRLLPQGYSTIKRIYFSQKSAQKDHS